MKKIVALLLLVGVITTACANPQPAFADQPAIGVNVQWPGSGGYYPTNGYPATYPTSTNVYYPVPVYTNGYNTNGYGNGYGYSSGSCGSGYRNHGDNGYWNQRRAWLEHERRERERRERREHERWQRQRWDGRR